MIIKNNFQRNLVMCIFVFLQCFVFVLNFLLLKYCFDLPAWTIILSGILNILYVSLDPFDNSKKIYKKYCNKECVGKNCSMWHCELHYKDGKYIK